MISVKFASNILSGFFDMPNIIKNPTVMWALAAFLAPFILIPLVFDTLGIYSLSYIHVWIISIPVCGFLAFRSYKKAGSGVTPVSATTEQTTPATQTNTTSPFGIAVVGAALGFGVGYLTRPTFLGQPIPLAALFQPVSPEFADIKSNFVMHMVVATGIGLFASIALLKIATARKT